MQKSNDGPPPPPTNHVMHYNLISAHIVSIRPTWSIYADIFEIFLVFAKNTLPDCTFAICIELKLNAEYCWWTRKERGFQATIILKHSALPNVSFTVATPSAYQINAIQFHSEGKPRDFRPKTLLTYLSRFANKPDSFRNLIS